MFLRCTLPSGYKKLINASHIVTITECNATCCDIILDDDTRIRVTDPFNTLAEILDPSISVYQGFSDTEYFKDVQMSSAQV